MGGDTAANDGAVTTKAVNRREHCAVWHRYHSENGYGKVQRVEATNVISPQNRAQAIGGRRNSFDCDGEHPGNRSRTASHSDPHTKYSGTGRDAGRTFSTAQHRFDTHRRLA